MKIGVIILFWKNVQNKKRRHRTPKHQYLKDKKSLSKDTEKDGWKREEKQESVVPRK